MNEARPHPTTPHKRSKVIFDLKDLEQKLGNDIEDLILRICMRVCLTIQVRQHLKTIF